MKIDFLKNNFENAEKIFIENNIRKYGLLGYVPIVVVLNSKTLILPDGVSNFMVKETNYLCDFVDLINEKLIYYGKLYVKINGSFLKEEYDKITIHELFLRHGNTMNILVLEIVRDSWTNIIWKYISW